MTSASNPHLCAYLMPIVQSAADIGEFELYPYVVACHPGGGGHVLVHRAELVLIPEVKEGAR
jgi:hypothetical protein